MSPLPWFPYPTRDAAAHMASRAHVFYLPVGTKHRFSELAQILSLLQKDLRGLEVRGKDGAPWGSAPFFQHFCSPRPSRLGPPDRHICLYLCVCTCAYRDTALIFSLLSGESRRLPVPAGPWRSLGHSLND